MSQGNSRNSVNNVQIRYYLVCTMQQCSSETQPFHKVIQTPEWESDAFFNWSGVTRAPSRTWFSLAFLHAPPRSPLQTKTIISRNLWSRICRRRRLRRHWWVANLIGCRQEGGMEQRRDGSILTPMNYELIYFVFCHGIMKIN